AVTDGVLDLEFSRLTGNVIEIALGVGLVDIDGGRRDGVAHREQGRGNPGRAASALRVADHALQRRAGDPVRVAVERELDGAGLDPVVQLRGRAVVMNVLRRGRGYARLAEGHADRA